MSTDRKPTAIELSLLTLLYKGYEFTSACESLGDASVKTAFDCILAGWIDQGEITAAGRALVPEALRRPGLQSQTPKFLITDTRTGKVVS